MYMERMTPTEYDDISGCILPQTAVEVIKHALLEVRCGVIDDPPGAHDHSSSSRSESDGERGTRSGLSERISELKSSKQRGTR